MIHRGLHHVLTSLLCAQVVHHNVLREQLVLFVVQVSKLLLVLQLKLLIHEILLIRVRVESGHMMHLVSIWLIYIICTSL